jgi:WD40 repeat protein
MTSMPWCESGTRPTVGRLICEIQTGHHRGIASAYVAPDGSWLATIGHSGMDPDPAESVVWIWDPGTGRRIGELDTGCAGGVSRVHIAPDASWLAVIGADRSGIDAVVQIWDTDTEQLTHQLETGHREGVTGAAISGDGRLLVTLSSRSVSCWDRPKNRTAVMHMDDVVTSWALSGNELLTIGGARGLRGYRILLD